MSESNPFADYIDQDKTILRPNPGGRKTNFSPPPDESQGFTSDFTLPTHLSSNPITAHATALLSLVSQLRQTIAHSDSAGLRNRVIQEIKQFEKNLLNQQIAPEQIRAAHYVLCAALDEAVLHTPWGEQSLWRTQSLLVTFHKEAWGGEKFFLILKNAQQNPATHLNLLELLYLCLSLGFKGKYHIQEQGASQLEAVRENVYLLIQRQRGDSEPELSVHWQGIKNQRNELASLIPNWVILSISLCLGIVIFMGFRYFIYNHPPLSVEIKSIEVISPLTINWEIFLATEIQADQVKVLKRDNKTIVQIIGRLFASSEDKINSNYDALLAKIASQLKSISTLITIEGHTDSDPIFTRRFPSNWQLSEARAEAVKKRLEYNAPTKMQIKAKGLADSKRIVQNEKTDDDKAKNRRVEIIF